MAGLLCKNRALFAQSSSMMSLAARNGSGSAVPLPLTKVDIGKREVVGYGGNGEQVYVDSVMCPFPAIRFDQKNLFAVVILKLAMLDSRKMLGMLLSSEKRSRVTGRR